MQDITRECPDQNKLCNIEFPMFLPCFDMNILTCATYLKHVVEDVEFDDGLRFYEMVHH
jgi:hypothetical protein